MKCKYKVAMAFLVVLALLVPLSLGCGGGGEKGVTIVIGEITDLTGPASPACLPVHYGLVDLVRYFNEEDLIPGVRLKLVTYDFAYSPARDLPGYDWCKAKGAEVIMAIMYSTSETLKPFAERDKVVIFTTGVTDVILEPPGWVFAMGAPFAEQANTILKWISENRWDYVTKGRVPKVGVIGWNQPATLDMEKGVKAYCQAHQDKFQWIGASKPPVGTQMFSSDVEKLKDADIIVPFGYSAGFIMKASHDKGYYPIFIADSTAAAYKRFYLDLAGWEGVDGFLTSDAQLQWWDEPNEQIELARELLNKWRRGEADDLINAGSGYGGGFITQRIFLEAIRETVERVGAENFSGQALYDTTVNFEVQFDGHPKWYYTATDRTCIHDVLIHEWSAAQQTLVRVTPDWLPLVKE
jgi:ABC-type branched-subunit amino acid transport system substrate-binding protein